MQVGAKWKQKSHSGMARKCLSLPRNGAKSCFKGTITGVMTVSNEIFLVWTCAFLG